MAEPDPKGPRPAQLPALQHLVVRYAKRGKMRFASHRDVARVFERGVRRAGLPIAYSAGFTPHPKISYAGGAPTGVASEAEYLSLALTSRQAAAQVGQRLNAALPDGIDVIDVTEAPPKGGPPWTPLEVSQGGPRGGLGEEVSPQDRGDPGGSSPRASTASTASTWRVVLPGVHPAAAQRAVAGFLALGEAPVERRTDKGVRCLDARAAVVEMDSIDPGGRPPWTPRAREGSPPRTPPADGGERAVVTGLGDCAILRMVVLHTAPAVRPEDVLTALRQRHGLVSSAPPVTTRLAQGPVALLTRQSAS